MTRHLSSLASSSLFLHSQAARVNSRVGRNSASNRCRVSLGGIE